ncbi:MAG: tripartite tricarboxylate transporter substrate binding protein [Cellvibrionaceae bacterium]|nr:tripartite tricarboxylate transporter substrate binding protein [Motiliproteus sp.]MCW9052158.1 tripartite tricarboxylate transporter substrate binding protein [Motiliproteus sp.]
MNQQIKNFFSATAIGAAALCSIFASQATAADWPSDNIRLVVPYSAGGTTDLISRKVADLMQNELGTIVVENRPGAGSTVATGQLSRGGRGINHTILMASPGHAIGPAIYPGLRFDPVKDFRFIRKVISIPNVMVVPASSPYNSLAELVEAAKNKEVTFSSPGMGSSVHMSGELFKSVTETQMVHVPFRGSGEALPALLSGDVDVSFDNMPTVLPHIKSGKLKALAITTPKRSPFLPDVPTVSEAGEQYGLSGFNTSAWFGVIAHNSLPDAATSKLTDALDKVMESEDFLAFLPKFGAEAGIESGDNFRGFISTEVKKWAKVAQEANIKR